MTPNITTMRALKELRKKKLKENGKKSSSGKKVKGKKKPGPKVKSYRILNGIPHKLCTGVHGCNQWVPLDSFYKKAGNRYHAACIECTRKSKASGYDIADPKSSQTAKPDPKAFWEMGCWKKIGRHNLLYRWTGYDWVRCSDGTRFFNISSALLP